MKFIDLSGNNIGESTYKYVNGVLVYDKTVYHDFDWNKSNSQGVWGVICKGNQGTWIDPACDILMRSCPLNYKGIYGYLVWTQKQYTLGKEVAWGQEQAHILLSLSDKYSSNVRVTVDAEQNRFWEKLDNTKESNYALNRFLKIALAMVVEIERLTGYYPILYTNSYLTREMRNFTDCPLWISAPDAITPSFYNWKEYAIHQYSYTGDGKLYGNYPGNSSVDLDEVPNVNKILIPRTVIAEDKVIREHRHLFKLFGKNANEV